jgi:hypothetical protein
MAKIDLSGVTLEQMYFEHPDFDTPSDHVSLWRYMDIARFLSLLHSNALNFTRVVQLAVDDPWEGVLPVGLRNQAAKLGIEKDVEPFYELTKSSAVVSCWHQNESESIAMWRLYTTGDEGVAIQTSVGHLKAALSEAPWSVVIGRVQYIDHGSGDEVVSRALNVLEPLFRKRLSFEHEREVRAVISEPDEPDRQRMIRKNRRWLVKLTQFLMHSAASRSCLFRWICRCWCGGS